MTAKTSETIKTKGRNCTGTVYLAPFSFRFFRAVIGTANRYLCMWGYAGDMIGRRSTGSDLLLFRKVCVHSNLQLIIRERVLHV